jgi:hypothetical protein
MTSLRYHVQTRRGEKWFTVLQDQGKAYCQGYLDRVRDEIEIRNEWRLLDTKTDKVLLTVPPRTDVSLGQIAGWASAKQYEEAAERAKAKAKTVREWQSKRGTS